MVDEVSPVVHLAQTACGFTSGTKSNVIPKSIGSCRSHDHLVEKSSSLYTTTVPQRQTISHSGSAGNVPHTPVYPVEALMSP